MSRQESSTVTEDLLFPLTETDFADKAKHIGELRAALAKEQAEFINAKNSFKKEKEEIETAINKAISAVQRKEEYRTVECERVYDYDARKVRWLYEGTEMKERDMLPEELQRSIPAEAWKQVGN